MIKFAFITASIFLIACSGAKPAKVADPAAAQSTAPTETDATANQGDDTSKPSKNSGQSSNLLDYKQNDTATRGLDHGVKPSEITPTRTEAALKFTVIDKDKGPIEGIVVKLSNPEGASYYTKETDAKGYAEVLVPVNQSYEAVYLSLGRQKIAARLSVNSDPNNTIRLVLRLKRYTAATATVKTKLVLEGVQFDTGKASLRAESYPKLDHVFEYMKYKSSVQIEISGHTDNKGKPSRNKVLSEKRAQTCRQYLISKGIDGERIKAIGFGQEQPIATNETEEGREKNRRIEATEL